MTPNASLALERLRERNYQLEDELPKLRSLARFQMEGDRTQDIEVTGQKHSETTTETLENEIKTLRAASGKSAQYIHVIEYFGNKTRDVLDQHVREKEDLRYQLSILNNQHHGATELSKSMAEGNIRRQRDEMREMKELKGMVVLQKEEIRILREQFETKATQLKAARKELSKAITERKLFQKDFEREKKKIEKEKKKVHKLRNRVHDLENSKASKW
ncbi:uncharacterized protein N7484_004856 [Penicillium longicatenatum]|uniref:uncharacterized protein n=1 Tax=Penicillium longicatenatum TaxID=1561947 RepID=UPI0025491A3D|nr:uncharacterized protein N7484_004856 [Penicillium longicatenatum]KAJ5651133.1 hypothetical protein N7484_004856 [Penicillium longicatenatum]